MKPEELKYNTSHEWVGLTEENGQQVAVIGISDFAVEQLTDLVYMALPQVGQKVSAEKSSAKWSRSRRSVLCTVQSMVRWWLYIRILLTTLHCLVKTPSVKAGSLK